MLFVRVEWCTLILFLLLHTKYHNVLGLLPTKRLWGRQSVLSSNNDVARRNLGVLTVSGVQSPERISKHDETRSPIVADIPSALKPLLESIINATVSRTANTVNQGHDSFRYEWGTWVNDDNLQYCMDRIDDIRLQKGAYEALLVDNKIVVPSNSGDGDNKIRQTLRLRVAGGSDWDCLLHVLPEGTSWQGRWPGGSWSILKTLTGMVKVDALTGPDRNGNYVAKTSRNLRGGSDGSLGSGLSSSGEDCVKYVGGRLRCYTGLFGKTVLLEVVVRPPIGPENERSEPLPEVKNVADILSVYIEGSVSDEIVDPPNDATNSTPLGIPTLGSKIGMSFDQVGGLDVQLEAIARRVLASRSNPKLARKFGVSHVRGILLSGPPGCGKTLLARELARLLGAREPQIVNGPEILDKYIGEAEKKVRELFLPAEQEYKISGDDSALHIIILDEMDAIARKRGTMTSDTTGVRDSVVNQLLAKMDGVKQASNILVVGLTNRPELLDPALLRPGRLEVHLRIELPDLAGRRDILRIHTRQMKEAGGLAQSAIDWLEDLSDRGVPARTEHFSGAELAGLIRSAASFALARTIESDNDDETVITIDDLEKALQEVQPALGKQDDVLKIRFPRGISRYSPAVDRILRELERFAAPIHSETARIQSLLLVGGCSGGGSGVTAMAAWAAHKAPPDYVRLITSLDILTSDNTGDEGRAAALVDKFAEAREISSSLLVLDDIDQLCAGTGPNGYSSVMLSTLRALLRSPPSITTVKTSESGQRRSVKTGKTMHILATTSRSDAACVALNQLFDETIVVPPLQDVDSVQKLLDDSLSSVIFADSTDIAKLIIDRFGEISCKTVLRLVERSIVGINDEANAAAAQLTSLEEILNDLVGEEATTNQVCRTFT